MKKTPVQELPCRQIRVHDPCKSHKAAGYMSLITDHHASPVILHLQLQALARDASFFTSLPW
jgi:hypothetical protein